MMDHTFFLSLSPEEQSVLVQEMDAFIYELNHRAKHNSHTQERAADITSRTPNYQKILDQLTAEQQDDLELYIAACEEYEHSLIFVAYMMGRDHQRKGIPPARLLFQEP